MVSTGAVADRPVGGHEGQSVRARGGCDEPIGRISGKLAREAGERHDVRRERQHRHAIHEILDGLADRPERPQVSHMYATTWGSSFQYCSEY